MGKRVKVKKKKLKKGGKKKGKNDLGSCLELTYTSEMD